MYTAGQLLLRGAIKPEAHGLHLMRSLDEPASEFIL